MEPESKKNEKTTPPEDGDRLDQLQVAGSPGAGLTPRESTLLRLLADEKKDLTHIRKFTQSLAEIVLDDDRADAREAIVEALSSVQTFQPPLRELGSVSILLRLHSTSQKELTPALLIDNRRLEGAIKVSIEQLTPEGSTDRERADIASLFAESLLLAGLVSQECRSTALDQLDRELLSTPDRLQSLSDSLRIRIYDQFADHRPSRLVSFARAKIEAIRQSDAHGDSDLIRAIEESGWEDQELVAELVQGLTHAEEFVILSAENLANLVAEFQQLTTENSFDTLDRTNEITLLLSSAARDSTRVREQLQNALCSEESTMPAKFKQMLPNPKISGNEDIAAGALQNNRWENLLRRSRILAI